MANKKNNRSSVSTTNQPYSNALNSAGAVLTTYGSAGDLIVRNTTSDPAVVTAALSTVNYAVNQSATAVNTAAQALRDAATFQASTIGNLITSSGDNIHAALTGVDALANKSLDATPAGEASVTKDTVKYALLAAAVIAAALIWAARK
jgi:hypothetical protein